MRNLFLLFLLAGISLPVYAGNNSTVAKVTVAQLEETLASAHGKADADLAKQLSGLELTERLNAAKLTQLKADLPGDKAREQLIILADSAAFLAPPSAEIPVDAAPDSAATHQMLLQIVRYVNTTLNQMPNLVAARDTIGFEDKPQWDETGATGITTTSGMPMHMVGRSSVTVKYQDRKEVLDESSTKHATQIGGLASWGEFGPILGVAVWDALQGKITWSRWEQGASGKEAVFSYAVPFGKSHYPVQYCCMIYGFSDDGTARMQMFKETVGYHGEIVFDPASGAILRITLEAELSPGEKVAKGNIMVEYNSVEIGGQKFICPVRSVSILAAHETQQSDAFSMSRYRGPTKTYMNDVVFSQYRRFGSESRILAGDSTKTDAPVGPPSTNSPYSSPSRAVTH